MANAPAHFGELVVDVQDRAARVSEDVSAPSSSRHSSRMRAPRMVSAVVSAERVVVRFPGCLKLLLERLTYEASHLFGRDGAAEIRRATSFVEHAVDGTIDLVGQLRLVERSAQHLRGRCDRPGGWRSLGRRYRAPIRGSARRDRDLCRCLRSAKDQSIRRAPMLRRSGCRRTCSTSARRRRCSPAHESHGARIDSA